MQQWISFWKHALTGESSWEEPDPSIPWVEHWSVVGRGRASLSAMFDIRHSQLFLPVYQYFRTPTHLSHRSAEFNRKFWLREDTGETKWTDPTHESTPADVALPEPTFTEKFSEEHGVPYWVDNATGESTWEEPASERANREVRRPLMDP